MQIGTFCAQEQITQAMTCVLRCWDPEKAPGVAQIGSPEWRCPNTVRRRGVDKEVDRGKLEQTINH